MRVEVTFGGSSAAAEASTRFVEDALKALQRVAVETGLALDEVKIDSSQATETELNARRMQSSLKGVQQEARQTRRDLDLVQLGGLQGTAANLRSFRTVGIASLIGLGAAASGPVGAAAGGAALGLSALLPGVLGGVGALTLAFSGMSKAIEGDKKAFDALTPSAQAFVQTIRGMHGYLTDLRQTAQAGILPGANSLLHGLFNPQNAATLQQGVGTISQSIGGVFGQFGQAFGSSGFNQGLGTVLKDAGPQLQDMGDAALHLATGLGRVLIAAEPLAKWITQSVDQGARLFDTWTKDEQASGGLAGFMADARVEIERVMKFLEALGADVLKLSRDLKPLGDLILNDLTVALQHFGDWLDRNRTEIANFTTGALKGFVDLLTTLWQILDPLATALYDVTKNTIGFHNAAQLLIAVWGTWKVATLIGWLTGPAGLAGALGTATSEAQGLRLSLLALGDATVILALAAAAYGVYKIFQGDKTAPDVVEPGNPYVKGSPDYDAYAAGVAGTKPDRMGRVQLAGGVTIPASNKAYQRGIHDKATGHIPTGSQNYTGPGATPASSTPGSTTPAQATTNSSGGLNAFGTPGPFTKNVATTAFALPLALQTAIDRASTTPGSADDSAANSAAISWVKQQIAGGLSGQALDQAYQLLSSLQSATPAGARIAIPDFIQGTIRNYFQPRVKIPGRASGTAPGIQQYASPARFQFELARDQALGDQKGILADLQAMRHAAEIALKSGHLTIQAQIQAWNVIGQVNQQLGQQAMQATDFYATAAGEFGTYGGNIGPNGYPLSPQDTRGLYAQDALLSEVKALRAELRQRHAKTEKHAKQTAQATTTIAKNKVTMIDTAGRGY